MTADDEQTTRRIDILLVEPSPGDARLFTESVRDATLIDSLSVVSDGDSAVDFLRQRGEYDDAPRPDLLLLEPQLPGTSGWAVIEALDDDPSLTGIPVVVLTGSDAEEAIVRARDVEPDHYVRKPVAPEEFVEFVHSVEEFWLAADSQAPRRTPPGRGGSPRQRR